MSLFYLLTEIGAVSDLRREKGFVRVGTHKGSYRYTCLCAHKSSQNFKMKELLGSFRPNTCTSQPHFTESNTQVHVGDRGQRAHAWNPGLLTPSTEIGWSVQSPYLEERLPRGDADRNSHWCDLAAPKGKYFQAVPVTLLSVQNQGWQSPTPHKAGWTISELSVGFRAGCQGAWQNGPHLCGRRRWRGHARKGRRNWALDRVREVHGSVRKYLYGLHEEVSGVPSCKRAQRSSYASVKFLLGPFGSVFTKITWRLKAQQEALWVPHGKRLMSVERSRVGTMPDCQAPKSCLSPFLLPVGRLNC